MRPSSLPLPIRLLRRRRRESLLLLLLPVLIAGICFGAVPHALHAQQRDSTARDSTLRDSLARRDSAARRGAAADSARASRLPARPRRLAVDSLLLLRPPVSPRRAFLSSLLVPGLGQGQLKRPVARSLFLGIELGAIAMTVKSQSDLHRARVNRRDSTVVITIVDTIPGDTLPGDTLRTFVRGPRTRALIRARRTHLEDWLAVIAFNHLFAGFDAFVAAQLWDVPVQVSLRPAPGRGAVLALRAWWR